MKAKPVGVDVILAMGGKKPPMADSEGAKDSYDAKDDPAELPPDYEMAYKEFERSPTAQSFWDAVEACVEAKSKVGSDERMKTGIKAPSGPMNFMKRQAMGTGRDD